MNNITTTDLSEFGYRELRELSKLINAMILNGLPNDFADDKVIAMMNKNSGIVFLTNDDYQVCLLEGDELVSFYTCPNCGHEGTKEDCQLNDEGCNECNP